MTKHIKMKWSEERKLKFSEYQKNLVKLGIKKGLFQKGDALRKGVKCSPEHIEKNRLAKKGKKYRLGQIVSEETRLAMSIAHKGQIPYSKGKKLPHLSGINSPRWISDRTKLRTNERRKGDCRAVIWRNEVKLRDQKKCQIADSNCSGQLEVHHILSWKDYPELRYEVNNGITLCHHHHPRKREEVSKLSPYFKELINNKKI
jgi:hypothetical protein